MPYAVATNLWLLLTHRDSNVQCIIFPAHRTDVANRTRFIFTKRRSIQDLLKSTLVSLYGPLVRLHLEYSIQASLPNTVTDISCFERIYRLAVGLVNGLCHIPYEVRLTILAAVASLGWTDSHWNHCVSQHVFSSHLSSLKKHPYKVLQGWRGSAFSVRGVKYWSKLPAFVPTGHFFHIFKKRLVQLWTEVFPV